MNPCGSVLTDDELKQIDVDLIERGPWQPREHFDEEALKELAESIEEGFLPDDEAEDICQLLEDNGIASQVLHWPDEDLRLLAEQIAEATRDLDPAETLFIVASKTFTTVETMANAGAARDWMARVVADPATQFAAISSATVCTSASL